PLPLILTFASDVRGPSVAAEPADKTRRAPHMDVRRFPRGQDASSENPAGSADPVRSAGRGGGVCFFAPGFFAQAKKGGSRAQRAKRLWFRCCDCECCDKPPDCASLHPGYGLRYAPRIMHEQQLPR